MDSLHGDITQPKTTDEFVRALYFRQSIVINEQKEIKEEVKSHLGEIRGMCTRITKLEEKEGIKDKESESIKSWVRGSILTAALAIVSFIWGYAKLYHDIQSLLKR